MASLDMMSTGPVLDSLPNMGLTLRSVPPPHPQLTLVETFQPQPVPSSDLGCGAPDPLLGPELPSWRALSEQLLC